LVPCPPAYFTTRRSSDLRYAGKDSRNKHLAADDGTLYAFIEKVRGVLPQSPARVFVIADEHYYRGRAAFHLYPQNVWFEPYYNRSEEHTSELQSPDHLLC